MTLTDKLGKKFVVTGEVEPQAAVSDSFLKKAKKLIEIILIEQLD